MTSSIISLCAVISVLLLLLQSSTVEPAMTCNVIELSPCLGPIMSGVATPACCAKLNKQKPCFCQYMHEPAYSPSTPAMPGRWLLTVEWHTLNPDHSVHRIVVLKLGSLPIHDK